MSYGAYRPNDDARKFALPGVALSDHLAIIGAIKTSPTFEALGYSAEEFVAHIERQFLSGMGWHNMDRWQVDHILPISGAKTVEDVIALNQLSNLRPLWAKENNAKKAHRASLL